MTRKYIYTWQDKEGHRHEGEMDAPDKDSVYETLRSRGIRAMKVTERIVPVVNRSFRGLRKRDWAILSGGGLLLLIVVFLFLPRNPKAEPRHYIDLPDDLVLTNHLESGCDAYLAQFVVPGNTNLLGQVDWLDEFAEDLSRPVLLHSHGEDWLEELQKVVNGIKAESVPYLKIPGGVDHFIDHLKERQMMEHARLSETLRKVARKEITIEEANVTLRGLGLQLPPQSRKRQSELH